MGRFSVEDLEALERVGTEPARLSGILERLVLGSMEVEAKVYDRDSRTGVYVVVLEGRLQPARD